MFVRNVDGKIIYFNTQRFVSEYNLDAKTLYRSLRRLNPSPFLVNLNFENFGLVASSPEILVRLRDNKITIRPIAGTRKRGMTSKQDKKLSNELLNDQDEQYNVKIKSIISLIDNKIKKIKKGSRKTSIR